MPNIRSRRRRIAFEVIAGGAGAPVPTIVLSANTIAENAANNTTIGDFSVVNGSGTYTFTITADPDNKFTLATATLKNDASFDYEAATSHPLTVQADNGIDPPFTQDFTVNVTNVTASSAAGILLDANGDIGFAMVASDDSMVIRDFATPANDYSGAPGSKLTTTRSGTAASYFDNAGLIQVASANTLRRSFNPRLGSGVPGYLSEGARTNLAIQNAAYTNAAWAKVNVSVSENINDGPFGATSMARATETGAGNNLSTATTVTVANGSTYCGWGLFKKGTCDYVRLVCGDDPFTNGVQAWFNLNTGIKGTLNTRGSGWTAVSHGMLPVGGGVYLCWIVFTTGGTSFKFGLVPATSDTGAAPNGGFIYYLDGMQLELGGFPSSAIATAATSVARSADSITLATSAFPFSATVGTLMFEGHTPLGSGTQVLWQCDDGTENERFRLLRNSSNEIHFIVTDGGSGVADLNLGTVANDTAFKVAVSWAADDIVGSLNGATAATDTNTSGGLPTVTTMRLGSSFTGEQSFAHCKRLMYLPLDKSAAQIEALAA